jgi:hypothetical protein
MKQKRMKDGKRSNGTILGKGRGPVPFIFNSTSSLTFTFTFTFTSPSLHLHLHLPLFYISKASSRPALPNFDSILFKPFAPLDVTMSPTTETKAIKLSFNDQLDIEETRRGSYPHDASASTNGSYPACDPSRGAQLRSAADRANPYRDRLKRADHHYSRNRLAQKPSPPDPTN